MYDSAWTNNNHINMYVTDEPTASLYVSFQQASIDFNLYCTRVAHECDFKYDVRTYHFKLILSHMN